MINAATNILNFLVFPVRKERFFWGEKGKFIKIYTLQTLLNRKAGTPAIVNKKPANVYFICQII